MLCGRKTRATGSGGSSERCSAAIHTAAPCRTGPMGTVGLFTCFLCGIVGVLFCHHCMCAQSCLTLCDPMDCSPPGYSVHGILQAKNTGVGCQALLRQYCKLLFKIILPHVLFMYLQEFGIPKYLIFKKKNHNNPLTRAR